MYKIKENERMIQQNPGNLIIEARQYLPPINNLVHNGGAEILFSTVYNIQNTDYSLMLEGHWEVWNAKKILKLMEPVIVIWNKDNEECIWEYFQDCQWQKRHAKLSRSGQKVFYKYIIDLDYCPKTSAICREPCQEQPWKMRNYSQRRPYVLAWECIPQPSSSSSPRGLKVMEFKHCVS